MTRDEILSRYPLTEYLTNCGIKLRGSGKERTTTRCPAVTHKPDHWCVSVNVAQQIWRCHDCNIGGSLIDWRMHETGKSAADVISELSGGPDKSNASGSTTPPEQIATYDYTDEAGKLLYQVVRFEPKTFRQRQPDGAGGWHWTMEGVTRVLYRLPEVLLSPSVVIVEGEKDVETLRKLGMVATCNVGGAGKWLDAYSECVAQKEIVIIPDSDRPGREHGEKVFESLSESAASIKVVAVPSPYKDITEFFETFTDPTKAKHAITELIECTPHRLKPLPIYSIADMESQYRAFVRETDKRAFDLGKFLPSLGASVRPMVPGELVLIMASTGVGKTAILQHMARAAAPLPVLMFELELPGELVFERFVQMEVGCFAGDVEEEYRTQTAGLWKAYKRLHHVFVCPESGLSCDEIERLINRSALKIGQMPAVVCVDYIGLVRSNGRSRYEAVSQAAEQMKVIAKRTRTIIIMASQISRPDKGDNSIEVRLHDGKDSGALENSSGLVLGIWRPQPDTLTIKILKNTKGTSGKTITCDYDGARMQIAEKMLSARETSSPPYRDP